ncbi:MAG: nucleoside hydrolase, partial [Lachnospira sp.]|nr:nucleoside hydrolase [Lachnospira sp.]
GLMSMQDKITVLKGAEKAIEDEMTPVESEGARLIVEEAMKDDDRPLYIAFLGPLTDMASALLMKPEIANRNITVIWIGGRDWPAGGWEYNLKNDVCAANVVFKSQVQLWQVPRNVYRMMPVSFAELMKRVYPHGEIGKYLAQNVIDFNNEWTSRPAEHRILGDSPAIGIMMFNDCGEWEWKPAPEFDKNMFYVHNGKNRPIKVYKSIDSRFILEDLYAKLELAAR